MILRSSSLQTLKSLNSEAKKNYVKLTFLEEVVIVPQCWGGLIVSAQQTKMTDSLPENVKANEQVNKKKIIYDGENNTYKIEPDKNIESKKEAEAEKFDGDYMVTYQYYFDCGNADKAQVEHAIKLFKYDYSKNQDMHGAITFVADESYMSNPIINNPIIKSLEKAMKEARYHVSALSKPKLSFKDNLSFDDLDELSFNDVNELSLSDIVRSSIPTPPPHKRFFDKDDSPSSDSEDNNSDQDNAYNRFITNLIS
jgi:hypothetical protein